MTRQDVDTIQNRKKILFKKILSKILYISKFLSCNLNLDLFRIESKSHDERTLEVKCSDFCLRIIPDLNYPETIVEIEKKDKASFSEKLLYGHLGLAKLITDYEFESILDIGSRNGTAAKAFAFLNKKVTTIEFSSDFESNYSGDYLDIEFPQLFDAIWCSHVLEHQRNLGLFLEKIYQDLKEGGVLALTVPSSLSLLIIGHPNIFTPLHLIYNLILAGFDCREAKIKCYDWQFTILVKKHPNGINPISFASTHFSDISPDGTGFVPKLLDYFPIEIQQNGHVWGEIDDVNWF